MAKFFQITGVSIQTSRHTGKNVYAVFFKADTGESYKTWVDPQNSNFRRWQNFLKMEGVVLTNLNIKNEKRRLIDADSFPKLMVVPQDAD